MENLVRIRRPGERPAAAEAAPPAGSAPLPAMASDVAPVEQPSSLGSSAPADGPKAYVETYGCQMNVADTEMVLGLLRQAGYAKTEDPQQADLILINTCAVREKAEERVFGRASFLSQYKTRRGSHPRGGAGGQGSKNAPDTKGAKGAKEVVLGITGCMAEHLKDKLQEKAPYVDLVVGPDGYRRLLQHIDAARGGQAVQDTTLDRHETYEGLDPSREMTGGVVGHVTIQRGCDKFCTFCIVPYTRGRERAASPREILRQVRAMVDGGYKEVQLLGQTVNSYRYEDVTFADLLRAVAQVDGLERVRFTSPYPLDFSADVIAAMAENPKVCKHVHLPLQSGSDTVLGRMRRGYSYEEYRRLVAALRGAMPEIAITTDIMVGFCDETEEEFQATLAAQRELRFDGAFTFAYSERSGTYAERKMPDTVSEEIKGRRLAEVIALQREATAAIYQAQVGRREQVLVEGAAKRSDEAFLARTDAFRPVVIPAGPGVEPGALLEVVIERASSATLFGRVL